MFAKVPMLSSTEKAAMEAVPHWAMDAIITIFPSWKMEFSRPEGRAMENMVPIILPSFFPVKNFSKGDGRSFLDAAKSSIREETILDMRVAIPTPKAPMWNTRMKIAFPAMLITFAAMEVHMVVLVFLWTRRIAFKELWEARKTKDMTIGRA